MVWLIGACWLLAVWYAFLINRYQRKWNAIPVASTPQLAPSTTVSVIIPVRNEASRIKGLLTSLQAQDYPKAQMEVLLVDDFSEDATVQRINEESRTLDIPVQLLRLQDHYGEDGQLKAHKKKAIACGIAHARGQMIVTTDADCTFPVKWLSALMHFHASTGAKMIAAPVRMAPIHSFLSLFQAIDFLTLQGITGAVVFARKHVMCNGANLCYEKKAFEDVNGFEGIDHIASGDDMLLMQKFKAHYPEGIYYVKNHDAIVTTTPAESWREFFQQRIRWAGKSAQYNDPSLKRLLALVYAYNASLVVLSLSAWFDPLAGIAGLLFLLAKMLIEFPFVYAVADFFGEAKRMAWFFLMQPFHIIYILVAGGMGMFGTTKWKGRSIDTGAVHWG